MAVFSIDFDGVLVRQDRAYDDLTTPLEFVVDPITGFTSRDGLRALRLAGHVLVLSSCRANRSLLIDPNLDPLVRAGVRRVPGDWQKRRDLNQRRLAQMLAFVQAECAGLFDAIDDGASGKVIADHYLDDRGLRLGGGPGGLSWGTIARLYGETLLRPAATTQEGNPSTTPD